MFGFITGEKSVWQRFKDSKKPIVLYGMGDGADKTLAAFARYGIEVSGVTANDAFVRGQSFHGFTVKRRAELEGELGDLMLALCFASQLPDVMELIRTAAQEHELLVPAVPVCGDRIFNAELFGEYRAQAQEAFELMEDDLSRRVFENVLRFYHTGDISLLDGITTEKDEAFNDILRLGAEESYVDLGAYDGDTIAELLRYSGGGYADITAFEPNPKNFAKLRANCGGMENVTLLNKGAWNRGGTLVFNSKAGRSCSVSDKGVEVEVTSVDEALNGARATYIKADVEGADMEALMGAERTLERFKPKLNYAAYHRFEDIFRLPCAIKKLNADYKIYLRHHPYIPAWDTNIYCV